MDWYCALTEHLLNKDPVDVAFESVLHQLKERIQALYKALLLYQMRSVCSFYQHQGLIFLQGLANWDDWDAYLKTVTDAEDAVLKDWGQYDQCHAQDRREKLAKCAEGMESVLQAIRHDIRDFIALQKGMRRDDKDEECLRDLFVVDPQDDMEKIERKKDELLNKAYEWVLNTKEYAALTDWNHDVPGQPSRRVMWIKGPAGTGKTMLLIGIIRELSSHRAKLAPDLSHFFCQGTDAALNSATATLRSLVWLLLVQQPHLISHIRSKHRNAGSSLFTGDTAFIALSNAFKSMLKDPDLFPVYFVIDALDECEHGLADLVKLISDSLTLSSRVKWIVSSRPTVKLNTPETERSLVELDAQKLQGPVNTYINHKLSALETRDGYSGSVLAQIKEEVCRRAENTFLWVALVFKELDAVDGNQSPLHGSYALHIIRTIPSGLSELYNHIMNRIDEGFNNDPQYCKNVLVAVTLAFRPPTLSELAVLAELPDVMEPRTIVRKCGSFLTVREKTVYLIHQSAKDYLDENFESRLHPAGMVQGHADISSRSIMKMSAILKQNIYNLAYGFKPKDMRPLQPDPLAPIRYSCVFWADHLTENGESTKCGGELADDGEVFRFLNKKILHWLESLSLLGKLPEAIQSIRKLLRAVQVSLRPPPCFLQLLTASRDRVRVRILLDY